MKPQIQTHPSEIRVERSTLVEKVVLALVDYVGISHLEAGSKLPPEVKLADQFGVSRLALREALNRLKALGFLEARHGNGWYVRKFEPADSFRLFSPLLRTFSGADMSQMMEIRMLLEPAIVALAAQRRSGEDLESLKTHLTAMTKAVEDRKAFIDHDLAFHTTLAQSSGNPILVALYAILTDISRSAQWAFRDSVQDRRRSLNYHRKILEAITNGDDEGAKAAMAKHIRDVWDRAED